MYVKEQVSSCREGKHEMAYRLCVVVETDVDRLGVRCMYTPGYYELRCLSRFELRGEGGKARSAGVHERENLNRYLEI